MKGSRLHKVSDPPFGRHAFALCLCSQAYEGMADGSEKAQVIRWQAEEKIQDLDPEEV